MFLIMVVHAVSMFLAEYSFLINIHKKFMKAWFVYIVINYRIVSNTKYTHFRFEIAPNFSGAANSSGSCSYCDNL
jgi:hypothetical protein